MGNGCVLPERPIGLKTLTKKKTWAEDSRQHTVYLGIMKADQMNFNVAKIFPSRIFADTRAITYAVIGIVFPNMIKTKIFFHVVNKHVIIL